MTQLEKMMIYAKVENKRMLSRIGGSNAIAGMKGRDGGYKGGRPSKKQELSKKAEKNITLHEVRYECPRHSASRWHLASSSQPNH